MIEKEGPIHISNVMLIDPKDKKPTRVGITREGGKRIPRRPAAPGRSSTEPMARNHRTTEDRYLEEIRPQLVRALRLLDVHAGAARSRRSR